MAFKGLNGRRFQKLLHCKCCIFSSFLQGHNKFLAKCDQVLNHKASIIETKALFTWEKIPDSTIVGEFRFLLARYKNSSVYTKGVPCSQRSQSVTPRVSSTEIFTWYAHTHTGFRFVPHQWFNSSQRMGTALYLHPVLSPALSPQV